MADSFEATAARTRKRYGKPEIKRVCLKAEEAVLTACKTNGKAGPLSNGNCQQPSSCSTKGS